MMTACAVHFGLDFGLVVRYLAGEYTAALRNVDLILKDARPYVSDETLVHMRRLLTRCTSTTKLGGTVNKQTCLHTPG